jgi:hypothetical protein
MFSDSFFSVAGQMGFTFEQMIDNFDNVFVLNGPLAGYIPYITYGASAPSQGLPSFQITHVPVGLQDNLYLRRGLAVSSAVRIFQDYKFGPSPTHPRPLHLPPMSRSRQSDTV